MAEETKLGNLREIITAAYFAFIYMYLDIILFRKMVMILPKFGSNYA